ncbi:type IV pilus biogenesis/stability protein PilW [Noviherbaspirillum sedimenti]|uniref:Type IV pilus biogenesis/stability protein PilW n=1 Tax=Noviherbaspirillum sedimenti TaxID=2320865 RepID=A0A3A3FXY9_9BURK|nr:type IV pilus biogenesis/stability protein PilW [Noviherbaspirillum sedimenti]RJG00481.1 type IV pilus biogenesis/stability protein PilW [Noviherbaspirillum sedimenti]
MKKLGSVLILAAAFLAGCASNSHIGADRELLTSSDQTDDQKRARIRLQLAVSYYQQQQLPVALDEIKQSLQADPNFADAYSVRGLIYMDMGETRLAEDNFQQALRLAPQNPDFNNNYGWFLCQNGRPEQSIAYFESALKNRSYQSPAKALQNAGVCSLRMKKNAEAERYLTEAFRLDPGSVSTNVNLAKIHYERGDYEKARFYIARVTRSDALSADALWQAIKVERKLGDRAAELSLVTQLSRRFPDSAEFAAYQRGAFNE